VKIELGERDPFAAAVITKNQPAGTAVMASLEEGKGCFACDAVVGCMVVYPVLGRHGSVFTQLV
jgi:hypothetical protein